MYTYDEYEATQLAYENASGYSHELYRAGSGRNRLRHELEDESSNEANMSDWVNDAQ